MDNTIASTTPDEPLFGDDDTGVDFTDVDEEDHEALTEMSDIDSKEREYLYVRAKKAEAYKIERQSGVVSTIELQMF